ncbi:hypothetical protein F4818DRAFT_251474 [Hypoxylon cercidicola]|nr:hypothetical protein F4818DRAFT_251474 [Hypoxylon cercidicola]
MDLRPTLEALGVDSLANLTLEELEGRIQAVGPSKYHTLQTCMGWLNEHTKNDIQQDLSHFVWMLLQQFGESEIKAVFEKWQKKDAEENPTNRRRYLLVKDEIFGLLKHMRIASNMVAGSSSGPSYLHREYSDTQDPIEDPVGLSLSDIHQMVFNKKNNKENRNKDLGKMLEENIVPTERESDYSVALKETRQPNIPPRASPRGYYVCKRCDRPGKEGDKQMDSSADHELRPLAHELPNPFGPGI